MTIPVTVPAVRRGFSKLKMIKTYMRSTMAQEHPSGLVVISINHNVSQNLSCDAVIEDFAAKRSRAVQI